MLKIKDNVDLKELEKFGFEENGGRYFYYGFTRPDCNSEIRIYIDVETREISTGFDIYVNPYKIHDKIYDLIQARTGRESRGLKCTFGYVDRFCYGQQ